MPGLLIQREEAQILIKKALHNYKLWKQYNPVYFYIQSKPSLRRQMKNDPGVKFMERGWTIILVIIIIAITIYRKSQQI